MVNQGHPPERVCDSIPLARSSEKLQLNTHNSPLIDFVSQSTVLQMHVALFENSVLISISLKSTKQTWQSQLNTIPCQQLDNRC